MTTEEALHALTTAMEDAAEAENAADRAEALRKRVFAEVVNHATQGGTPVSKAEYAARADQRFVAADNEAIDARSAANIAKAKAEGLKLRFEAWRTRNATRRAEMNLR